MAEFKESTGEEWKGEDRPFSDNLDDLRKALENLSNALTNPKPIDPNESAPEDHYVLDGEIVRPAKNMGEWIAGFNIDKRRVAIDTIKDGSYVSTVFLGLDHSHGQGTPILFETMAWHNGEDFMQYRYPTYEAALTGHRETVEELKIAVANDL